MMGRIHKEEFIGIVAVKMGCQKALAADAVNGVLGALEDALQENDKVTLTGFGTFEVRETAARSVRMIAGEKAGEMVQVPPGHRVAFVAGKNLIESARSARA